MALLSGEAALRRWPDASVIHATNALALPGTLAFSQGEVATFPTRVRPTPQRRLTVDCELIHAALRIHSEISTGGSRTKTD